MMRWVIAAIIISAVVVMARAQGVDNPGTNPQEVTCNEFGVCNSLPGGGGGPPLPGFLLLETSGFLLLEGGGKICLEGNLTC